MTPKAVTSRRDVWVAAGEIAWAAGGINQVVRLFRLAMPLWNVDPVPRQEAVFGRTKVGNISTPPSASPMDSTTAARTSSRTPSSACYEVTGS
jgi:deferrochelatase/peroxidase EfeB